MGKYMTCDPWPKINLLMHIAHSLHLDDHIGAHNTL